MAEAYPGSVRDRGFARPPLAEGLRSRVNFEKGRRLGPRVAGKMGADVGTMRAQEKSVRLPA